MSALLIATFLILIIGTIWTFLDRDWPTFVVFVVILALSCLMIYEKHEDRILNKAILEKSIEH